MAHIIREKDVARVGRAVYPFTKRPLTSAEYTFAAWGAFYYFPSTEPEDIFKGTLNPKGWSTQSMRDLGAQSAVDAFFYKENCGACREERDKCNAPHHFFLNPPRSLITKIGDKLAALYGDPSLWKGHFEDATDASFRSRTGYKYTIEREPDFALGYPPLEAPNMPEPPCNSLSVRKNKEYVRDMLLWGNNWLATGIDSLRSDAEYVLSEGKWTECP